MGSHCLTNWFLFAPCFKAGVKEHPSRCHKKSIRRGSTKRESGKIPLAMGQATKAGCGGCNSNSRQGGKGRRGCDSTISGPVPSKASEVRACMDLEGHIFTVSSGNKGKDEDRLRTTKDKMAKYIGVKFGDNAVQELTSNRQTVLQEPSHLRVILARHAERVKVNSD